MDLEEIVLKLTGNVEPTGDSAIDEKRLRNLENLLDLMRSLHCLVDSIATDFKDSHMASEAEAGKKCDEYLDWLGIPED